MLTYKKIDDCTIESHYISKDGVLQLKQRARFIAENEATFSSEVIKESEMERVTKVNGLVTVFDKISGTETITGENKPIFCKAAAILPDNNASNVEKRCATLRDVLVLSGGNPPGFGRSFGRK